MGTERQRELRRRRKRRRERVKVREREHLSRKLPIPDSLAVPYFTDSPVASLIDEFTFLDATVARRPSGGRLVEASGLWRPVWARLLLWERGGQALEQLRTRVHP